MPARCKYHFHGKGGVPRKQLNELGPLLLLPRVPVRSTPYVARQWRKSFCLFLTYRCCKSETNITLVCSFV